MTTCDDDWPAEHSGAATAEGWDIFECGGSEDGPWQIQRLDEEATFPDDPSVWVHVWTRALAGSRTHQAALRLIFEENRPEYDRIHNAATEA